MKKTRWILEGEWIGYTSAQIRVVHREVISGFPKMRAAIAAAGSIIYMDGTRLQLSIRDAKPRERVQEISGYKSMIRDCVYYGVWSVAELQNARQAARRSA